MKLDYRNVKKNYELLPVGWYEAKIKDVVIDSTKNNNEVWKLTLSILDEKYFNRLVRDNIIFKDTLDSRNKEIFKAFGFLVDEGPIDVEPNDLLNKVVKCKVIVEKYEKDGQEKEVNKVEFFDGYKEVMDNDEIPF